MKIVITGHTGFIGSYIVPLLKKEGHEIIGLSRLEGKDILSENSFTEVGKFDVLIHLAAQSFVPLSFSAPHKFYYENFLGTLNCLEACRRSQAKMIFLSSYIYGLPQFLPISEDHPACPTNPYMESKYLGEQLCRAYYRDFKVSFCIIRPFNVYGIGQSNNFLIPTIVNQIPSGKILLNDSKPRRDFVHASDLAAAIHLALNFRSEASVYNIGSGRSISISEIIQILKENSLVKEEAVFFSNEKRPNEVLETRADISKAKHELGWVPKKKFDEELVAIALDKLKLK